MGFTFGNSGFILRCFSAFLCRGVAHGFFCKAGILCGTLRHIVSENGRIYCLGDILAVLFGILPILCILNIFCVIAGFRTFTLFRSGCLGCLNLVFLVHALLDLFQGILHLFDVITLLRDLLKQGYDSIHLCLAEVHIVLHSDIIDNVIDLVRILNVLANDLELGLVDDVGSVVFAHLLGKISCYHNFFRCQIFLLCIQFLSYSCLVSHHNPCQGSCSGHFVGACRNRFAVGNSRGGKSVRDHLSCYIIEICRSYFDSARLRRLNISTA